MATETDEIKKALTATSRRDASPILAKDLLSSGSTLLNLAASDRTAGTFCKGKYHIYVGDSASGKTWLALCCLAEAAASKHFEGYRLLYDNAEDGALMNIERYFGKRLAARLEPPRVIDGQPVYSRTVEEMYYHLDDALAVGKPFIFVEDSLDALDTKYATKKFTEGKKAARSNKPAAGDYGDGKAKINSTHIRRIMAGLRDTGSILVLISQTRDNIGAGLFEPGQVYAGGRALKFYAAHEIWTSIAGRLKKDVNGKPRQIGVSIKAAVKKNRLTGKERSIVVPIYWSTGIDDVGSQVDFLAAEKHWAVNKSGVITATDFEFAGHREQLVQKIEEAGLEKQLRAVTAGVWGEIEMKCAVTRKPRYQ